ncbi:hypothetical protein FRC12_000436 [Ceratobasidium sp. 428]|nr:hypothetical protein FRC12_000436 [Ceratobasidium sp. 428]
MQRFSQESFPHDPQLAGQTVYLPPAPGVQVNQGQIVQPAAPLPSASQGHFLPPPPVGPPLPAPNPTAAFAPARPLAANPSDIWNKEVSPGVWEMTAKVSCPNGELKTFPTQTNVAWAKFHATASQLMGLAPDADIVQGRLTKSDSKKMVMISSPEGWEIFMSEVRTKAPCLRSARIDIEIESKCNRGKKGAEDRTEQTKVSRDNDLPPPPPGKGEHRPGESRDWYYAVKKENHLYCYVMPDSDDGPGAHKKLSLELIGKWVNKCMNSEANAICPPDGLFDDDAATSALMGDSSHLNTPDPEAAQRRVRCQSVIDDPFEIKCESPDLPDTHDLIGYIKEKSVEALLICYPRVEEALQALDAAKPDHKFLTYLGPLNDASYRYVDEIACSTPESLVVEAKMFPPVACALHHYAGIATEQVQRESVQLKTT